MRRGILILMMVVSSPLADAATLQRARFLMGTTCEIATTDAAGAAAAVDAAFEEAERIESMLSTWRESSELTRLNAGDDRVSTELTDLLAKTLAWSDRTGGAFNPRIKTLIDLWKTREEGALPDSVAIRRAVSAASLRASGFSRQGFEEGAFGKGYALDAMLAKLSGNALIDFGGQVAVRGSFRVAIADPRDRDRAVAEFTLVDGSLSTSSGSEKTFRIDDRDYSHILDPRSGMALPPRGSVSVIADDALTADILSTALYVMGEDDGLRWADANGVAAIYITPQNIIRLSEPARERVRELQLVDRNFEIED